MIKSNILWNEEEYNKFIKDQFGDISYGIDHIDDPCEYPCILVAHTECDNNYTSKYRRSMDYYYGEWVSLANFLDLDNPRILDYLQEKIMEKYHEQF